MIGFGNMSQTESNSTEDDQIVKTLQNAREFAMKMDNHANVTLCSTMNSKFTIDDSYISDTWVIKLFAIS